MASFKLCSYQEGRFGGYLNFTSLCMETRVQRELGSLSHEEILALDRDYLQAAKKVRLKYVSDSIPGITRVKKGSGFSYVFEGRSVRDAETLTRIKTIVIPPAWTRVWICPFDNGHIQATGYDVRNRKQYRYHQLWNVVRSETKFHRLYEFGKALPGLRLQIEKDMQIRELSLEKVLATIVSLMERTYIRVGSEDYNRMYGSHGITTLKDNHVRIQGSEVRFSFIGKKGISQTVTVRNARLARMVKQCRDIPGKELFQYYDDQGQRRPVESGMVNEYIKSGTGGDFTAKDFRTWAGSLNLLQALRAIGNAITVTECKKNIVQALDEVSRKLGNSRAVCRKYYVHPGLIDLYEKNELDKYLKELDRIEEPDKRTDLTSAEKVLMKILNALSS
jgi:DNA topoisomerase I